MKFKIDVHPQAVSELEEIHACLSPYSGDAADRVYLLLKHGIRIHTAQEGLDPSEIF